MPSLRRFSLQMSGKSKKDYTEPTVSKQCVFLLLYLQELVNFVVGTGFFSFFMLPLSILWLLLSIQHSTIVYYRHSPLHLASFSSFFPLFSMPFLLFFVIDFTLINFVQFKYIQQLNLSPELQSFISSPFVRNPLKKSTRPLLANHRPALCQRHTTLFTFPIFFILTNLLGTALILGDIATTSKKSVKECIFCCYVCFMRYNKMRDVNRKYAMEIALPGIRQHYFFSTAEHVCRKVCH